MAASEEKKLKLKVKNTGQPWPEDTHLYIVDYDKHPFNGEQTSIKVGTCNAGAFKQTDLNIKAPDEAGEFYYDFRYGTESLGLFEGTYRLSVKVVKKEKDFFEAVA